MQQAKQTNRMFPNIGFGMGLRPVHYQHIFDNKPALDWFEVISENYMDTEGRPRRMLEKVLEDYPVVMHGVSLSIGTVDPLQTDYLRKLKKMAAWVNPPWISDHLCWTGIAHKNTHDLLPVPYTEEALRHIVSRIRMVQDMLERPLVLENPSTYLEFSASSMPEWEFIARMAEEADCGLLLDVNNVYVSCFNHKWDARTYINALPLHRVAQIHLAGHSHKGTHIIDTHDAPVMDDVWRLYKYVLNKGGMTSTMVEWDESIPAFPVVMAEVTKARKWAVAAEEIQDVPNFSVAPVHKLRVVPKHLAYKDALQGLQQAILKGAAAALPPELQIPSKPDFDAAAQLGVYINGYKYRLFDTIYDDFRALRGYLGHEEFCTLVDSYIQQTPSQHFSIARYADDLPAFTAAHHADPIVSYLASFEKDLLRVADMPETACLTVEDVADVTGDDFASARLILREALCLRHYPVDVNNFYTDVMQGQENAQIQKMPCYIVLYRHADDVLRLALSEKEFQVLMALHQNHTVADALSLLEGAAMTSEEISVLLAGWFARWMQNGLLSAIQLQDRREAIA